MRNGVAWSAMAGAVDGVLVRLKRYQWLWPVVMLSACISFPDSALHRDAEGGNDGAVGDSGGVRADGALDAAHDALADGTGRLDGLSVPDVARVDGAIVDSDGAALDALVADDATVAADSGVRDQGAGDTICTDNDLDLFSTCAGDCNDNNPAVKPSQSDFFALPTLTGSYDYDCDGIERLEYPAVVACVKLVTCEGSGWDPVDGVPGCGRSGRFVVCGGSACKPEPAVDSIQRCR